MKLNFGATTIAITGWITDSSDPELARKQRIETVRKLVQDDQLQAIELTLDLALFYPHIYNLSFYNAIAELQNELGFSVSIHLPFIWLDCSSLNEDIRLASIDSIRKIIKITSSLNVKSYVLHLWGITSMNITRLGAREEKENLILSAFRNQARKSLEALTNSFEPNKLCVETLIYPDFSFILPTIQEMNAGICLDVGHMAFKETTPIEFFKKHHNRICEIHLHDAIKVQDVNKVRTKDHLPLGAGDVPISDFLQTLQQFKFTGNIIIENNNPSDLAKSIKYLKRFNN